MRSMLFVVALVGWAGMGLAHTASAQTVTIHMVEHAPAPTAPGATTALIDDGANFNTDVGVNALASNTTGSYNTASGAEAHYYTTGGWSNTASGAQALYSNTMGVWTTA